MKPGIVADGKSSLYQNKEFQSRLRELHEAIRKRHLAELATAGFFRRLVLRWRMAADFRRERRTITPSPQSLYGCRFVAGSSER